MLALPAYLKDSPEVREMVNVLDRGAELNASSAHEARMAAIAREIVQAHARGSIPLQMGLYRTPQEIDSEFESIKDFEF